MKPFRILLIAISVLAVFQLSPAAQAQAVPRRVNIILIVADGLAANDLSCYGQAQFQTPHLDQLAAGGIRFTNYLAGGVAGSPARAALMTGKDTSRLPDADFTLAFRDLTIAQILKNSGYNTMLVGEWNLGGENSAGAPWRQGFDEFAGYFDASDAQNVYPDYLWKYDERYSADNQLKIFNGREMIYYNTGGRKQQYVPDSLFQWTLNYTETHKPDSVNHHQPFFVTLDQTVPGNGYREVPTDAPFSEEAWPPAEKNRAATIERLDNNVGKLMDELKNAGDSSNTVVIFTSDTVPKKGGGVDPKFFQENSGTDDLHVPFIVYWPGRIPGGQVSGAQCSASDVLPTIASLALANPPDNIDGRSLTPIIFGREARRESMNSNPK